MNNETPTPPPSDVERFENVIFVASVPAPVTMRYSLRLLAPEIAKINSVIHDTLEERENQIKALQVILNEQELAVREFATHCENQMATNTLKIAEVFFLRRGGLRDENNTLSNRLQKLERIQAEEIASLKSDLETMRVDASIQPLLLKPVWEKIAAAMEKERQAFSQDLLKLEAKIIKPSSNSSRLKTGK